MFGLNMVVNKGRTVFIADTTVHEYPSSSQLSEIAISSARVVRLFGFDPKIAFLSHSTFGQPITRRTKHIRDAVEKLKEMDVDTFLGVAREIENSTEVSGILKG